MERSLCKLSLASLALATVLGMATAGPGFAASMLQGKKQPVKQKPVTPPKPAPAKPFQVSGEHIFLNGLSVTGNPGDFKAARAGQWVKLSGFDNPANNGMFRVHSVAVNGSAIKLSPYSKTVSEAVATGKVRTVESSSGPAKEGAPVTDPQQGTNPPTGNTEPPAGQQAQKNVEEQVPPFTVTGDHLWINGLAVMGKEGDFKNARAGQWIKLSGFETAANNGTFLVESVDQTGTAINLDPKSATVFEAATAGKVRTAARSEPPGQGEGTKPVEPAKGAEGGATQGKVEDPKTPTQEQPKVTNVAVDSDLRAFLKEMASQTGVTIIPDETITEASVSIEFQNEPLESALEKISLMVGAYWKKKGPGFYLMSKATPKSSLFREFAKTTMYVPKNQTAATIGSVLSNVFKEYVAVDPKVNMIGITAPEPLMNRILADVRMADSRSKQIVVEAMVAELTYEDGTDFGFSWSWKNFSVGSDLGMTYAKASFPDIARLKSLIDNRQATLLANPRLTAFEGRDSFFTVGQETYYSLLTGNANFPFQQIQLIKTGITLKFVGFVDEDGTITLNLDPEVSDAVVAVNGNPTTNVRRASTSVRVKPGETIVLAGLSQHTTDRRVTRVPILGFLPILGELFKSSKTSKRKTDVIMMITPQVTDNGINTDGTLKDVLPNVKKTGGG